jgi:phospholipase/carboxylesterase
MPDLDFHHVYRPGQGDQCRTLLLLHGTGGDERDLIPLGVRLAPGWALLGVRGKVLEGSLPRWFRRLAPGVFDEADIVARAQELAAFLSAAGTAYGFSSRDLVAVGLSNGANMAAALLLLHPGSLAGAVLFRAMVPLTPTTLPDLAGLPVLIAAGRSDPMVPPVDAERLRDLLAAAGAAVELAWVPSGHGLTPIDVETARDWLGQRFPNPSRST